MPPSNQLSPSKHGFGRRCPLLIAPGAPTAICSFGVLAPTSLTLLPARLCALPPLLPPAPGKSSPWHRKASALQTLLHPPVPRPMPHARLNASARVFPRVPLKAGSGLLSPLISCLSTEGTVGSPREGASPREPQARHPRGDEGKRPPYLLPLLAPLGSLCSSSQSLLAAHIPHRQCVDLGSST